MEISQFIYLAQTGEYISILALENIDQIYILMRPLYYLLIAGIVVLLLVYARIMIRQPYPVQDRISKRKISIVMLVLLLITFYNNAYELAMTPKYAKYFRHGQPTPAISLLANAGRVFLPPPSPNVSGQKFMFEKDWVYQKPLPFSAKSSSSQSPNVIVILTEGTSTRLMGCYDKKYEDLTPNFNKFAQESMKVTNYYNHTSATYRGTLGQMASCYPFRGGKEAGAWDKEQKNLWSTLNYSTVPKILENEYDTIFFSPHESADSYTDLVRMAGFRRVETKDSLPDVLGKDPEIYADSFTDASML